MSAAVDPGKAPLFASETWGRRAEPRPGMQHQSWPQ